MERNRDEVIEKCHRIREWFEEAGIELLAIRKLRTWTIFKSLTEKQFSRWVFQTAEQGEPRLSTRLWVNELDRRISQGPDEPDRRKLEALLGIAAVEPVEHGPPIPGNVTVPSLTPDTGLISAGGLCTVALKKARQGLHDSAWRSLKIEFDHYASRDLEFAMVLAPTLIYLAYRYFSTDKIAQSAITVLHGLEHGRFPFCSDTLRNLCIVQLCTSLSEHGQGRLAEVMLNKHEINALLNAQLEVPWPQAQIIRTMATHQALHQPAAKRAALAWVDRAEELNADPSNRRAYSAVRYTIHTRHGDFHDSCKDMIPDYERSREILSNAAGGAYVDILESRQVANDVYLGAISRSLWDKSYDSKQQADDIHCLNWALNGKTGVANQEMDDVAMGIPADKLPPGLQILRQKLLRKHFKPDGDGLREIARLIRILTGESNV